MKWENLRYYTIVILMVLSSGVFNTMIIIWVIEQFTTLHQNIYWETAIVIYIAISIVGLRYAIPRFRGVI
ncbi:hypothetical protein PLUA15_80057 [Pseudomonas lundensis]|jgi:hypothetical protein|uniref:Uncharacterized protein n=1 Tax=Pseudomonas lundensis TaxID=86185 RepID=A0AAX2HEJ2_9PSED|nr:hypothetical protein PLUA15_80057 [Pseudomonas lundensis]